MGWVVMSERELNRVEVLAQVDDGRLRLEGQATSVSHETIYAYVYSPDGQ